jgi:hypothetical protein
MMSTALQPQQGQGEDLDQALVELLTHRYGDGLVYLRKPSDRQTFQQAVGLGLVSAEGYITPLGHSLLARHGDD